MHATAEPIADVLARLSRVTGVTLVPRIEVADERVSVWADDRTLMQVMRDLRHLHGYFWSRARRGGRYVYSFWQDAQSRSREEAETERIALEEQHAFQQEIAKHLPEGTGSNLGGARRRSKRRR